MNGSKTFIRAASSASKAEDHTNFGLKIIQMYPKQMTHPIIPGPHCQTVVSSEIYCIAFRNGGWVVTNVSIEPSSTRKQAHPIFKKHTTFRPILKDRTLG